LNSMSLGNCSNTYDTKGGRIVKMERRGVVELKVNNMIAKEGLMLCSNDSEYESGY